MNNFYLEIPNIKRKEDIIDYINELELYNSEINGIELLAKILEGHKFEETLENCLKRSNKEYAIKSGKNQVNTYLLITHITVFLSSRKIMYFLGRSPDLKSSYSLLLPILIVELKLSKALSFRHYHSSGGCCGFSPHSLLSISTP